MTDDGPDVPAADDSGHVPPVSVHVPVLLQQCVEVMDLRPGLCVIDGTVGAGGHALAFARAIAPGGTLLGLDRDESILSHAEAVLRGSAPADVQVRLEHSAFSDLEDVIARSQLSRCDRVFLDIGVSSLQLDSPTRGFSFMHDGPLDMRMDRSAAPDAAAWLARVKQDELERVLRDYGEERHWRRVARAIVDLRKQVPFRTTRQLADVVERVVPRPPRRQPGRSRIHPATRVFQAIRIAVNDELRQLEKGLAAAERALAPGGRLAVISFHSLEDRVVKNFLRDRMELPFRKPERATADEVRRNPRARSARLRCGIKRSSAEGVSS